MRKKSYLIIFSILLILLLTIPQSVSDNWYNTLVSQASDAEAAVDFLSAHGIRLSKINEFFDSLNDTDRTEMERLLKKMGVISTSSGGGGGGAALPPAIASIVVKSTTYLAQIADPAIKQIIITFPASITAPNKEMIIPTEIFTAALNAGKTIILDFNGVSFEIPPGAITPGALAGATLTFQVKQATDITTPDSMVKKGNVFEFVLMANNQVITTFAKPVTVAVSFAGMDVTTSEMEKLGLYRYINSRWVYLGGIANKQKKQLYTDLDSFSTYRIMLYSKTFTDIQGHWAQRVIELLASRHVIAGMTDTTFAPQGSLTRAQTAALLVRSLGLTPTATPVRFSDVRQGAWYHDTVQAAAQSGLIGGYPDGMFRPNQEITSQEYAAMIVRAARMSGKTVSLTDGQVNSLLSNYSDKNSISTWARKDMAQAIHLKLVGGFTDGTLGPLTTSTRAQGSAMLERLIRLLGRI